MHAVLKFVMYPLVRPSLGVAAILVTIIYVSAFFAAVWLKPDLRPLMFLASIPLFWVSLRVLLRVGRPPETIGGSIIFALLLLNLLLGFGGVVLVILYWSRTV